MFFCHITDMSVYLLSPHGVYFLLTAPHTPSPDIVTRLSHITAHWSPPARPGARGPTLTPTQQRSHKAAVLSTAWCRLDQSTTFIIFINHGARVTTEYITYNFDLNFLWHFDHISLSLLLDFWRKFFFPLGFFLN